MSFYDALSCHGPSESDHHVMRVIVVGGGIGGLAAALGLRRAGHGAVVLERAPRIDPAGAGITLFANAMCARWIRSAFGRPSKSRAHRRSRAPSSPLAAAGLPRCPRICSKERPPSIESTFRPCSPRRQASYASVWSPLLSSRTATASRQGGERRRGARGRARGRRRPPLGRPARERWSGGRVVLLGDAAHATTPGVGQGAAQALEDAVVLAGQLALGGDRPGALAAYASIRRPRTEAVLTMSRRADRAAQLASPARLAPQERRGPRDARVCSTSRARASRALSAVVANPPLHWP